MFISLDLETTGFDPIKDRIVEFGAVKFDLQGNQEKLQFLVNPGIPLPAITTYITGIKDEDLSGAPKFDTKAEEVKKFIGDLPIIGHNITFDTNFLIGNGIEIPNPKYDTLELASILLPHLPSYSLEIITHELNLKHEEKHRALDDAIAAMELFLQLTDKFQSLSAATISEIHTLLQKTEWPLKNHLLSLNSTNTTTPATTQQPQKKGTEQFASQHPELLKTESSQLFEITPPYENLAQDLATNANKDSYIAVPHHTFMEVAQQLPNSIAKIGSTKNYISPKRLEDFKNKKSFEDYEITSLLKYLIWLEQTDTGILSELTLFKKEKLTLSRVNTDPNFTNITEEPFIKKALKKDKENPALCTHGFIFDTEEKIKELIIINFESFIRSLHKHTSTFLNVSILESTLQELQDLAPENKAIETLISKSTILFGLIGIFFEKYNDGNPYLAQAQISAEHTTTKEWNNIREGLSSLIKLSTPLGEITSEQTFPTLQKWKSVLSELVEIFHTPQLNKEVLTIEKDFHDEIVVKKTLSSLKEKVQEMLNKTEKFTIIDESIDLLDDGTFTKALYGIPQNTPFNKIKPKKEPTTLRIAKNTPDDEIKNRNILIAHLTKELGNATEPIAILFSSRKQMEFFTLKLHKELTEKGKNIVSQLTGSLPKLSEKFIQEPKNTVITMTTNAWDQFPHTDMIKKVYIHKIPFDAPSNPLIVTLSQDFPNPFIQLQIPRAIFSLKKIINRTTNGTVTLFDSRIVTKDYSKTFLKNLQSMTEIEIFTIDF